MKRKNRDRMVSGILKLIVLPNLISEHRGFLQATVHDLLAPSYYKSTSRKLVRKNIKEVTGLDLPK